MSHTLLRLLVILLRMAVFIYVGLIVVLAIFQRKLIYMPDRQSSDAATRIGKAINLEPWLDKSGALIGWKRNVQSSPAANRLLVFHGNAGSALDRLPYILGFEQLDQGKLWQVFVFEYPGYGPRPDEPSETSIRAAADAALSQLLSEDSRPIWILGESLGSGPACALAHARPNDVAGLLLVTPFSSMGDAAAAHYPYIPVRWILRDPWDNSSALAQFTHPLGILQAGSDTIIPIAQGRKLFAAAREPKKLWVEQGSDHNDLDLSSESKWWREASDFLLAAPRSGSAAQ